MRILNLQDGMFKSPLVQQVQARPESMARQDHSAQQILHQEMARQAEETVAQPQAAEQEGIRREQERERRRSEQQKKPRTPGGTITPGEAPQDSPPPPSPAGRIDIVV